VPRLVFAAVLLLVATNVVVLSGVAYNRAGGPPATIELTERELTLEQSSGALEENSGAALSLHWQAPGADEPPAYLYAASRSPDWLDEAKLFELGVDTEYWQSERQGYSVRSALFSKEVVLVLEYNGAAYRRALSLAEQEVARLREKVAQTPDDEDRVAKLERYEKWLQQLQVSQTRLYAVDAGLDREALAGQYPDGDRYLLVRGQIGLSRKDGVVTGRIRQMYVQRVHVPLPYSQQLPELVKGRNFRLYGKQPIAPRYRVRINSGRRLEPWVVSVSAIDRAHPDR
jgi:hypothetical protein